MEQDLQGTVAVVVGASSGIGLATATLLAGRGATVMGLARDSARLKAAVTGIGQDATSMVCDATDPTQVRAVFAEIAGRYGRLDMLVNMLGSARLARVEQATDEDIEVVVGTNLLASMYTTRSAVPLMRASGGGDILNVSSESTMDHYPYLGLYGAAKAGLEQFSKAMTKELRADGIRVSLAIIGRTNSSFSMPASPQRLEEAQAALAEDGCIERIGGPRRMEPEWVAEAIIFAMTRPKGQMLDVLRVRAFT